MTPLESFTRLAAVGVRVPHMVVYNGELFANIPYGMYRMLDTHATALLCNAVLEKWPDWTVERGVNDLWYVTEWDEWDGGRRDYVSAPTRLAALTLAAEAKHKENSDASNA